MSSPCPNCGLVVRLEAALLHVGGITHVGGAPAQWVWTLSFKSPAAFCLQRPSCTTLSPQAEIQLYNSPGLCLHDMKHIACGFHCPEDLLTRIEGHLSHLSKTACGFTVALLQQGFQNTSTRKFIRWNIYPMNKSETLEYSAIKPLFSLPLPCFAAGRNFMGKIMWKLVILNMILLNPE